jgi:hypothetical protein
VRAFGSGAKPGVTARSFNTGKCGDRFFACARIGEKIKSFSRRPRMPGDDIRAVERDKIAEIGSAIGKDAFENVAFCKDRRAGVYPLFLPRLATGT